MTSFAAFNPSLVDHSASWLYSTGPIQEGDATADVLSLQQFLLSGGYLPAPFVASGSFDSATTSALRQLQSDLGIPSDGVVGTQTRNAVIAFFNGPTTGPAGGQSAQNIAQRLVTYTPPPPKLPAKGAASKFSFKSPAVIIGGGAVVVGLAVLAISARRGGGGGSRRKRRR